MVGVYGLGNTIASLVSGQPTVGSTVGAVTGSGASVLSGALAPTVGVSASSLVSNLASSTVNNLLGGGSGGNTYAFENVAAILQPFDQFAGAGSGGPLGPIQDTGGLIFPFNPTITEGINVAYEPLKVVQSNESYHVYQNTENVQINLGDSVWVADTFQNARYVLAVIHFFRSYSLMDFGQGRSGKPPSPMWFTAYGNYAFDRVPVLMLKADWTWPSNEEMDYVGIPEPGSAEWNSCTLATSATAGGGPYTWVPIRFKVNAISLMVQHSPRYWIGFNLDDYRSGAMLKNRGGFHVELPLQTSPVSPATVVATTPPGTVPSGTSTITPLPSPAPTTAPSPTIDPSTTGLGGIN